MELFTKVDYPRDEDSLTPRIISIEDYFRPRIRVTIIRLTELNFLNKREEGNIVSNIRILFIDGKSVTQQPRLIRFV